MATTKTTNTQLPDDTFVEAVAPLAPEKEIKTDTSNEVDAIIEKKSGAKTSTQQVTDTKTNEKPPATESGKKTFSDFGLNKFIVKALDDK